MAQPKQLPTVTAKPSNYPVLKDRKVLAAVEEYAAKKAQLEVLEARLKELRPTIEAAMDGAPVAYAGARVVSVTTFAPTPSTPNVQITKAMIGQVIEGKKGRAGYTQLKVT
jgi:hypothetical protein